MKVKVCGITSVAQMQSLEVMGVDYAGIILYPKSARYAGEKLQKEKQKIQQLGIKKIGVFVNETAENILSAVNDYGLYAVQLHGDETPSFCKSLLPHTTVIKAIRVNDERDLKSFIAPYADACHFYLFDTDTKHFGGSGQRFNWQLLEAAVIDKPFFLSGGIGPADVEALKAFHHPFLYAVDVNSRFETAPGVKGLQLVQAFIDNVNAAIEK